MEHAIGEIITLPNGRKAKTIEGKSCKKCIFAKYMCNDKGCSSAYRADGKDIIYKEIKEE